MLPHFQPPHAISGPSTPAVRGHVTRHTDLECAKDPMAPWKKTRDLVRRTL
jgi:hypothetical protein